MFWDKKFGDYCGQQHRQRLLNKRISWQRDVYKQNIGAFTEYCSREAPKSLEYTSFKRKLDEIRSYIAMLERDLFIV